ncbi:MAG: type II secretion system protein GspG [Acidobacteriota bacterium]|nr:type II secretion system protein GspG [Acidobacteriota bacterium]
MEPDVPIRRAPGGVAALAMLADFAAIVYLTIGLLGFTSDITAQHAMIFAGIAIYGLSRLAASHGLRRLQRFGAVLELLSAIVWVAFTIIVFVYFIRKGNARDPVILLPGFALALIEFVYFRRVAPLFAAPGLPLTARAAVSPALVVIGVGVMSVLIAPAFNHGGSRQKRTMADMRTIATAWEARATDINRYNAAAIAFPTTGVTIENLTTSLSPTYLKVVPMKDGWGNGWQFGADRPWGAKEDAQVYVIISYGKDGESQRQWAGGATTQFDCDIIYSNGAFLQYPEGVQQQ